VLRLLAYVPCVAKMDSLRDGKPIMSLLSADSHHLSQVSSWRKADVM